MAVKKKKFYPGRAKTSPADRSSSITFQKILGPSDSRAALDFFQHNTTLAPAILADLFTMGAVWRREVGRAKLLRLRDPRTLLKVGDALELHYRQSLMKQMKAMREKMTTIPSLILLQRPSWGIWFKPAGVLSQGTVHGDYGSLLRHVELEMGREIFLIHRLDFEVQGPMVLAYTSEAAGKLGELWKGSSLKKIYQAEVLGDLLKSHGEKGDIRLSLDGKDSWTSFKVIRSGSATSRILVHLHTGRFHQIRRHMAGIGHPVMGDPLYGIGNKNRDGLKLAATALEFTDPMSKELISFELPPAMIPF